jgi:hypothetical protein
MKIESLQRAFAYVDVMLSTVPIEVEASKIIGISSLILAAKVNINIAFIRHIP